MARNRKKPNKTSMFSEEKPVVPSPEVARVPEIAKDPPREPKKSQTRIYRNPSGRSARIAPDLRVGHSSKETAHEPKPPLVTTPRQNPIVTVTLNELIDPDADFSVARVTGSYRREHSIEGLLLGTSVGDAIGLGRDGLSRTSTLRIMGRGPLNYCLIPGVGIVSADTHRMLMTLQSILRSRSQLELFRRNFAMRLKFYLFSLPVSAGRATLFAAMRLWLGVPADQSGIESDDNSPLVNALAIATVLQGTGHSVERWVAVATEVTQAKPAVVNAAVLVARAGYLAIMTDPRDFDAISLLERLTIVTSDKTLADWLNELRAGLEEKLGTHAMARRLGWGDRIPETAGPTAIMAIYAWLRHHHRFEKVVESAVLLGGDSVTLGALSGGLAGINLGAKSIPSRWLSRLWSWPNNRRWLDTMTRRFTDWPHGSEDLHAAPAMPIRAGFQLLRSGVLAIGVAVGNVVKIPWKVSYWIVGS